VREAVGKLPGAEFGLPREVELKGLQGSHTVYAVSASDSPALESAEDRSGQA
jgi:hypothetical protein